MTKSNVQEHAQVNHTGSDQSKDSAAKHGGKQVVLAKDGHQKQFTSASSAAKYLHQQLLDAGHDHPVGTLRRAISACCNGSRYMAYGFRACFAGHKLPPVHHQRHPHKPVVLYRDGKSKQFASAMPAAQYVHAQLVKNQKHAANVESIRKAISACCNGSRHLAYGYQPCFAGQKPKPIPDGHQATSKSVVLSNHKISKRFKSAAAAARWVQANNPACQKKSTDTMRRGISACCNGRRLTAYGFQAKFA